MAQLATPQNIQKVIPSDTTTTTVTVTWDKGTYAATTVFAYQFVNKGDPTDIVTPATPATAAAIVGDSYTVTLDLGTNAIAKSMADYIAEVQAQPPAGDVTDTASAWGAELYWVVGPTLTVRIGNASYTLTKETLADATKKIYRLPASADNPITIAYTDIQSFATSLGLTAPTTYPNGSPIDATLDIYELVVDVGNGLFSLSISVQIGWNIIPGLTIDRLGLAVKRTNGSL